jgi:hypothetical protein
MSHFKSQINIFRNKDLDLPLNKNNYLIKLKS